MKIYSVNLEEEIKKCKNIAAYVKQNATKNDVASVINAVDKYTVQNEIAMHVGNQKGHILDSVVQECNPSNVIELGTFFGYSALRIARLLKPGSMFYSIEANFECAKVSYEMIEFAGMSDKVKVLLGNSSDIIPRFKTDKSLGMSSFDFVFIDHGKDLYFPDLILMESLNLLKNGCVILADNVLYPGAPKYLDYVRENSHYKCSSFPCKLQNEDVEDALEKSVFMCG